MHNLELKDKELFYIVKAIFCYLEDPNYQEGLEQEEIVNMLSICDKIAEISEDLILDEPKVLN